QAKDSRRGLKDQSPDAPPPAPTGPVKCVRCGVSKDATTADARCVATHPGHAWAASALPSPGPAKCTCADEDTLDDPTCALHGKHDPLLDIVQPMTAFEPAALPAPTGSNDAFDIWWNSLSQKSRNEYWPYLTGLVNSFNAGYEAASALPSPGPATKKASYIGAPACFALEQACQILRDAFGEYGIYLVGSALERADWRDVDVRYILSDEAFAALFPDA